MKDERFTELLGKKLAGELSSEESSEFGVYIATSESYRDEYESLKSYWIHDEAPDQHMADVLEKIKTKAGIIAVALPETNLQKQVNIKTLYRRLQGVAAVLIIGLLFLAIYQVAFKKQDSLQNASLKWKRFYTPSRVVSKLSLPDGTQVTLNAASSIRYPEKFTGDTRDVYLTGEAYLDVAHDGQHPFILHTSKMDIHVLGTAFNVKSYATDSSTEATLFRGSIAVTFPEHPDTRLMLKPSEKIVLNNSGYQRTKSELMDSNPMETLWIKGQFAFRDESLGSIANGLSRKYGVQVNFSNQRIKDLKFSGSFEKESLDEALSSLQLVTFFNYSIKGDSVYFY